MRKSVHLAGHSHVYDADNFLHNTSCRSLTSILPASHNKLSRTAYRKKPGRRSRQSNWATGKTIWVSVTVSGKTSGVTVEPTPPSIRWVLGFLCPRDEADHLQGQEQAQLYSSHLTCLMACRRGTSLLTVLCNRGGETVIMSWRFLVRLKELSQLSPG